MININLIIRIDDISPETSSEVIDNIFKFIHLLNAKVVLGVIPFSINEKEFDKQVIEKINIGISSGFLNISQHGYKHVDNKCNIFKKYGRKSELNSINKDILRIRLHIGKIKLENIFNTSVNSFIPPWNSYNNKSVKVISDIYKVFSPSLVGGPYLDKSKLNIIPSCLNSIEQLKEIVTNNTSSCLLLHTVDFEDNKYNQTYQRFNDAIIDKKITYRTFNDSKVLNVLEFNTLKFYNQIISLIKGDHIKELNYILPVSLVIRPVITFIFIYIIINLLKKEINLSVFHLIIICSISVMYIILRYKIHYYIDKKSYYLLITLCAIMLCLI